MAARGEPGECEDDTAESKRTIPPLCARFTLGVVRVSPSPPTHTYSTTDSS